MSGPIIKQPHPRPTAPPRPGPRNPRQGGL
jgi:hypothetical protein